LVDAAAAADDGGASAPARPADPPEAARAPARSSAALGSVKGSERRSMA